MSRQMQITVTIRPFYHHELQDAYPKLAQHLGRLDRELVARNPSLYEIAGRLDNLLYTFDGTPVGEVLRSHRPKLLALHKDIESLIADWNLAQADKLLYKLEDVFDEIEAQLAF